MRLLCLALALSIIAPCHSKKATSDCGCADGKASKEHLISIAKQHVRNQNEECVSECYFSAARKAKAKRERQDTLLELSAALRRMESHLSAANVIKGVIDDDKHRATSDMWTDYALSLFDAGRQEEALLAHEESVKVAKKEGDEEASRALYNFGTTYQRSDRPKDAAKTFKLSFKLDQTNAKAASNWGESLAKLELHEEAIKAYTKALEADRSFFDAEWNLALSLLEVDKRKEAKKHLKKVAKRKASAVGKKAKDLLTALKKEEEESRDIVQNGSEEL